MRPRKAVILPTPSKKLILVLFLTAPEKYDVPTARYEIALPTSRAILP